jgi:hypothetical protein
MVDAPVVTAVELISRGSWHIQTCWWLMLANTSNAAVLPSHAVDSSTGPRPIVPGGALALVQSVGLVAVAMRRRAAAG